MKFINIICLLSAVIPGAAFASPATDCFKSAMSDPAVLTRYKAIFVSQGYLVENQAVALCANASDPAARITCYKTAMTDTGVAPSLKSVLGNTSSSYMVEDMAIRLCSGSVSTH